MLQKAIGFGLIGALLIFGGMLLVGNLAEPLVGVDIDPRVAALTAIITASVASLLEYRHRNRKEDGKQPID